MRSSGIRLRPEHPQDVPAIERVTREAFLEAPHTSHTEHFIVGALRTAGQLTVSRVATRDSEVIGHVAISPVQISGANADWFGLGPVSVLPKYQGRGIGSALVMEALLVLSTRGAAGCVVLGEPDYYERFGFTASGGLTLPGVPPEYFMAVAFDQVVPTGIVSYHEAFDARG
jgi:putative acetyltransferase